jgi:hypothetical protein
MHILLSQLQVIPILVVLLGFSALAFWSKYVPVFMITSGLALMTGLKWYDVFNDDIGLSVSLGLIAYAFICLFFALRFMFWSEEGRSEG